MKLSPAVKLTLLVIPIILVLAGWTFWQQLQEAPTRQAGIQLPPYGIVTVQLTTDPFPPVVSGPVQMIVTLQAPGGRTAQVDRVTYTYGPVDGNELFEGQTRQIGIESFQGPLQLTEVGDWWVNVRLEYQGRSGEARLTVPVRPAL